MKLRVKAAPGASRSEIVGILGDRLKIRIAAQPEHGKANQALLLLIADWLGTKNIDLIAGHASAEKTLRVTDRNQLSAIQLNRLISQFLSGVARSRMALGQSLDTGSQAMHRGTASWACRFRRSFLNIY